MFYLWLEDLPLSSQKNSVQSLPRWGFLEHHLWQIVKLLKGKRLLVAYSGGEDSSALVHGLAKVKNAAKLEIVLAHVHHGGHSNYRREVALHCERQAGELGLPIYLIGPCEKDLKSESEMRQFRREGLVNLKIQTQSHLIVTAHHQEDLLETRLIRLIRGTGAQGFRAMQVQQGDLLRPFLEISKTSIREYVKDKSIIYLKDPSNSDEFYLRNWIRNTWLPALEEKRSGGSEAMARSLSLIAEALSADLMSCGKSLGVKSPSTSYLLLQEMRANPLPVQRQMLATYLLDQQVKNFSHAHIKEILRRLDNPQKVHSFQVAGCTWRVNAGRVCLIKPTNK